MEFVRLPLLGLFLIRPKVLQDSRGIFVKTFHRDLFQAHQIDFEPKEEFYSVSNKGVLRGMHFQFGNAKYGKLIHCPRGQIYDVSLDIRRGSPTFGESWGGRLDGIIREGLYLPPGIAHGYYALEPDTIVHYSVSQVHDPAHDMGIRWDSFGHRWPCQAPLVSERDRSHPPLSQLVSPFQYP